MTDVVERTELITLGPAEALARLLGVAVPDLAAGDTLPLPWHWVYLLDKLPQADLGVDGHPVRGSLPAPPRPGVRRMFAGGEIRSYAPLRCGELATRRTRVLDSQQKEGRTGTLTFVTVGHEVSQHGRLVIAEQQSIVYRELASPPAAPNLADAPQDSEPTAEDADWTIDVTPTLLFRFSALTYNAHRIHYDRDYAQTVEGYPGLVTHGPLQVLAVTEALRARGLTVAETGGCVYRLVAPLFDHEGVVVRLGHDEDGHHGTVSSFSGRVTARVSLTPPPPAARS
jgi:3-methylfumaryl-CoA hydratase